MADEFTVETAVADAYRRIREGVAVFELPDRLVRFEGSDVGEWLQGQVANDLRPIEDGGSIWSAMLSPTGQMEALLRIGRSDQGWWASSDPAGVEALMERVHGFVIAEDVAAHVAPVRCRSAQGPSATSELAAGGAAPIVCLTCDRTGSGGWDAWIPVDDSAGPADPRAALEIAALEYGIPVEGRDFDSRTLGPELGPAFERLAISYSKGCYSGQEVVMRIHSRGHTNRTWMAILAEGPLRAGDGLSHPNRSDAGVVTAALVSPRFGPIAGAMVRREAAIEGDAVELARDAGPVRGKLRHFPLNWAESR